MSEEDAGRRSVESDQELRAIFDGARTIAIVGASNDPSKASFRVGSYLKDQGYRIVPVNPRGGTILGEPAYPSLEAVDMPVDVVEVFRPSEEAPAIAAAAVDKNASVLWLQTGIVSEEAARIATAGGLAVVMDACMGTTHERLGLGPGPYAAARDSMRSATKVWTLVAAILGSSIVFLDSTIVNVALPQIGRELDSTLLRVLEAQSYVYYGYLLALSSLLILAGALADYHGRRKLFGIGLVGFGITSLMCGIAPNMEALIVSRILQGAAGAVLVPGSLSLITATFQGEEQGRAFGIWAGASAATTILGPVLGGALVTYVSWRAAFLLNLPLVGLALWATLRHVSESRDDEAEGRFHWTGAALVAIAVGGLSFGAIRGQARQWEEPAAFAALAAGALALAAIPTVMRRSRHPLVPPGLFRSRTFTVTNVVTLVVYGAIYVAFYLMPLFAIGVLGYNEVSFGIAGLPAEVFLALFSTRVGALASRHGPRAFMAAGPAIMGIGLLLFARIPADSEPWLIDFGDPGSLVPPGSYVVDFLPAFVLFGIGLTILVAPLTTALMRSVPRRNAGVASAVNNAISRVGPQLAGALLFIAITARFYGDLAARLPGVDTAAAAFRERVAPLNPAGDVSGQIAAAARLASTEAFHIAMAAAALLCFAGAAVAAFGVRNPPAVEEEEEAQVVCPGVCTPGVESEREGRAA